MSNYRNALYRETSVEGYDNPVHTFAMDYYKPGSQGEDEFSRKEVWFYFCGDDELSAEFEDGLVNLLRELFVRNSVDWDFVTLAPSNEKDGLNENMYGLCVGATNRIGIEYRQVLRRTRTVEDDSEMGTSRQKLINLADSMEVTEDVEGKDVIIVNNVSVSGFELAHCTDLLLEAGAERVCSVCLGVTNSERIVKRLKDGVTASQAIRGSGVEGDEW